MRLDDCSNEEVIVLVAIVALAADLPGEFTLYSEALGELRRKYFKKPGRTYPHRTAGYIDGHQIKAGDGKGGW